MRPDVDALPEAARALYRALLSLRGRRVCVQVEDRKAVRAWAVARGARRFDEDLALLVRAGLVIDLSDEGYDEVQVLTPEQSEGAEIFAEAERAWPAHRARLEAEGWEL